MLVGKVERQGVREKDGRKMWGLKAGRFSNTDSTKAKKKDLTANLNLGVANSLHEPSEESVMKMHGL